MQDILFIDIDGTLLTKRDDRQYIPPSAMAAISAARDRGALAYLCTGRCLADAQFIWNLWSCGTSVDGIIGASGSVVLSDNKILFHKTLGTANVVELEEFMRAHHAHYYVECNEGMFFDGAFMAFAKRTWGVAHLQNWDTVARPLAEANRSKVNKLCFRAWDANFSMDEVLAQFGDRFYVVPASLGDPSVVAGEVSCKGINKATAIELLLNHLALPQVRTFGFGDSSNDIEMLDACDEAIVMGDAREPHVKEHATYVTSAVLDDGLASAMAHFGLA